MTRYIDFLRTVVVSFEFVVFLLWGVMFFSGYILPDWITANAVLTDEKIKWIALLPAGIMALVFKDSSSLLFPDKDTKEIITDFPDYGILRNLIASILLYSVVFAAMGAFAWFLNPAKDTSRVVLTLAAAVIGAGIAYLSFHRAVSTINIIFASNGKIS